MVCYWCTCTIGYVVLLIERDITPYFVASSLPAEMCAAVKSLFCSTVAINQCY